MESILTIIVSSLIGGIVAYAGAVINSSLATRAQIDQNLRDSRTNVYKDLWRRTGLLPQWPKSQDVTYAKLTDFSRDLRHWYFNDGGIYLSTEARETYGKVQETVSTVLQDANQGKVTDEHYEQIREVCSQLRTELTHDLLSRRRTFLS